MLHHHPMSAVGPDPSLAEGPQPDAGQPSGAPAASSRARPPPAPEKGSGAFRFWHDERRFKGRGDTCIVQRALFEAGGVRTGGYPKAAPVPGPLGFQRMGDWDLLWSPARTALKATPDLKPGQLISAMPGMYCLTKKRRLATTLHAAYGDAAWALVPLSFALPGDMGGWRRWLDASAAGGEDPGPMILKTAQHLGKGLKLLPAEAAFLEASRPRAPVLKPFVLAQRYVADPLLLLGDRKFGIRLWVLVTGHDPLRAYVHQRGLVLFSSDGYDSDAIGSDDERGVRGHITNYAQNTDGAVWSLDQLQACLGDVAWQQLWSRLCDNAARVVGAAVGELRSEHAKLQLPPNSTFELLGLDYLVDCNHHPWLLEVNGTPSLAVEHADTAVEDLIWEQKASMAADMVTLLRCRRRFAPRYALMKGALLKNKQQVKELHHQLTAESDASAVALAMAELGARGGFEPLFPSVASSPRDLQLRAQLAAADASAPTP